MSNDTTSDTDARRFSLGALLTFTHFVALVCAGWATFGSRGIAPACAVVAFIWFSISRTTSPTFIPINRQRMTVVELLTIVGVCAVLHGLSLPAVQSGPHPRRLPAPPPTVPAAQPNSAPATSNATSAENESAFCH